MKKKIRIIFKASIVLVIMLAFVMPEGATITKPTLSEVTFEFSEVGKNPTAEFEWVPIEASGSHTISGNEITLYEADQLVTLEIQVSGWDPHLLKTVQAAIDSAGYSNGVGGTLIPYGWPGSPEDGAFIDTDHPNYVFNGFTSITAVSTATLDYIWGTVILIGDGKTDDGQTYYFATLILDVPTDASGTYTIGFIIDPDKTFMNDDNGQAILPLALTPALITIAPSNEPPYKPSTPSGPTTGTAGFLYTYSTSTIDPDGDDIQYGWDWDGDNIVDEYSNLMGSGNIDSRSHSWPYAGIYNVKVKAKDEHNALSSFSSPLIVTISSENNAPNKPIRPSGETNGKPGIEYEYASLTSDPDGDDIFYMFDWGDGNYSGWIGPYNSSDSIIANHTWTSEGTFNIRVQAKDEHGLESEWSEPLTISMPKNKLSLGILLDRFPILYQFLQRILLI
jgi:hypothetical protein